MTRAGVGLVGTPGTGSPAAHRIASLMSAIEPPHLPSTRTAWTRVCQFTPATPTELLLCPTPIVPATWLPCQLEGSAGSPAPHSPAATASPGSLGSASRPPPSFAVNALLIMS